MNFSWKGREIATVGDIMWAMEGCESIREAEEFVRHYAKDVQQRNDGGFREALQIVENNLGYLTGYLPNEKAKKMRELFDVEHPIFGSKTPTAEEAFAAGQAWAAAKGAKKLFPKEPAERGRRAARREAPAEPRADHHKG
jgi:hypothetical protein